VRLLCCRKYIFKANIYGNSMLQKSEFTFCSLNHLNPIGTEVYLPPAAKMQNAVICPYRMVPIDQCFPNIFARGLLVNPKNNHGSSHPCSRNIECPVDTCPKITS
jgi:hypothetical protein